MTEYKGYTFEYHYKFKKEFNKIFRKRHCPTIKTDFKLLYDVLIQHLMESNKLSSNICFPMAGLKDYVTVSAFIIKRFRCKGIKKGSRSGFRITFLFDVDESRFIFVEIFEKKNKELPNKNRINELFTKEVDILSELYENEELFLNQ